MPIYEYRCPDGHTFEVFQRMTEPPREVCEVCGKGPVEKVLVPGLGALQGLRLLLDRLRPRRPQEDGELEGRRLGVRVDGREEVGLRLGSSDEEGRGGGLAAGAR